MGKIKFTILILSFVAFLSGCADNAINQPQANPEGSGNLTQEQSECENAGGIIEIKKECDGSDSEWCRISEKEQCYSDQIKKGRCTVGKYDEELDAIVGITPRVLCDNTQ